MPKESVFSVATSSVRVSKLLFKFFSAIVSKMECYTFDLQEVFNAIKITGISFVYTVIGNAQIAVSAIYCHINVNGSLKTLIFSPSNSEIRLVDGHSRPSSQGSILDYFSPYLDYCTLPELESSFHGLMEAGFNTSVSNQSIGFGTVRSTSSSSTTSSSPTIDTPPSPSDATNPEGSGGSGGSDS